MYVYKILRCEGSKTYVSYIQSKIYYIETEFEKLCDRCKNDINRESMPIDEYLIKYHEFEYLKAEQCYRYEN